MITFPRKELKSTPPKGARRKGQALFCVHVYQLLPRECGDSSYRVITLFGLMLADVSETRTSIMT